MRTIKSACTELFNLSDQEYEDFSDWAIGHVKPWNISAVPELWNERHKDLLELSGAGDVLTDLAAMIVFWKKYAILQ